VVWEILKAKSIVLGSGINQSSRASNETPQEGSIWFTSADGNKFVVSVALHESAEDFAPYGRWNFAYYMYSTPGMPGETFTAENSPATGFVLVAKTQIHKILAELSLKVTIGLRIMNLTV